MNASRLIAALALTCAPLIVSAQTAGAPGGQASTGTPIEQKPGVGAAPTAPGSTATSPNATNPGGNLSKTPSTTPNDMSKSTSMQKGKPTGDKSSSTAPGDAPTYPAPARDGTPTK